METKLNYNVNVPEKRTTLSVNDAKTSMSKQAVVNQAILGKTPQQPGGGMQIPAPQVTGFGRTR